MQEGQPLKAKKTLDKKVIFFSLPVSRDDEALSQQHSFCLESRLSSCRTKDDNQNFENTTSNSQTYKEKSTTSIN